MAWSLIIRDFRQKIINSTEHIQLLGGGCNREVSRFVRSRTGQRRAHKRTSLLPAVQINQIYPGDKKAMLIY